VCVCCENDDEFQNSYSNDNDHDHITVNYFLFYFNGDVMSGCH
jgi:hypothetical protein